MRDHFPERTSHLPLRTLHQAVDSASNPLGPLPHYPRPGGMREAMKSGHRALRGRRPCGGTERSGDGDGRRVTSFCKRRLSGHLLQKPTPYHGVISPSHRRPGLPPGPHKLDVLSTFTICCLLLTSTWSGLSWAAFGCSWSHLGVLSGSFWVLLGASWAPVGPSGAPVGCSWGLLAVPLGAL